MTARTLLIVLPLLACGRTDLWLDDGLAAVGDPCVQAGDCASGYCEPGRVCAQASCSDRIKNGKETGMDCGGTCASCSGFCASVSDIPVAECQALEALYQLTDGPAWTVASGWLVDRPCSWYGVTCSAGHVATVVLVDNGLQNTFPVELANLTELTELNLNQNVLSGPLPREIALLGRLETLMLWSNLLDGSIPEELGYVQSLRQLSIHANRFTGSIPTSLAELSALEGLQASGNLLSGSLPPELGNLHNLDGILLWNNQLTGTIPVELNRLTNLNNLYLYDNQLEGPVPTGLIAPLHALVRLYLANNLFDQAAVDAIAQQLYAARHDFDANGADVSLQGNASPSGNHTDPTVTPGNGSSNADWQWNGSCHVPLTGKAMLYALAHDNCSEGFATWTVSFEP